MWWAIDFSCFFSSTLSSWADVSSELSAGYPSSTPGMSFQPLGSQQVSKGSCPLTWAQSSVPCLSGVLPPDVGPVFSPRSLRGPAPWHGPSLQSQVSHGSCPLTWIHNSQLTIHSFGCQNTTLQFNYPSSRPSGKLVHGERVPRGNQGFIFCSGTVHLVC